MWLVRRSWLRRFGLPRRLSRKPTTTTRSSAFAWDWRVDGSWAICCPVSVGGDQGRDAESHWTDLPSDDSTSWFAVLASTDSVVLACTIQKRDVAGKIRRDLSTITATGTQVNRVIYFTVTAVPIAQRHELQMYARATHGIELDIWDAQAIAQNLADHDLFHLAVDHLHLATDLAPEPPVAEPQLPHDRGRQGTQPLTSAWGS